MTMLEPVAPWLRELSRLMGTDVATAAFVPPADVMVDEQGVSIHMDVPGIRRENLEIELENDTLTVRGERPFPYPQETGERTWRHFERRFGRFERSMRVPGGLDPSAVEASLQDGVLSLRVPRPQEARPRRVEIRAGGREQMGAGGGAEAAGSGGQPAGTQPGTTG